MMKKRRRPTNRYREAERQESETLSRLAREAQSGDPKAVKRLTGLVVRGIVAPK